MNRPRRPQRSARPAARAELEIDSIAAGGEGVGRLSDGRVLFVHRTAPGDRVEVELTSERPRWARGRLLRVVHPSPERREAPCPHYDRCGGCTLEHLNYRAQLEAKRRIAAEALRRIGALSIAELPITASPEEFRYRNRVSFALIRTGRERVDAGFHALGDPGTIIPIDGRCLLPEEPIALVWDRLRAAWGEGAALLPAGRRLRLTLRATSTGSVSLLIEGGDTQGDPGVLLERVEGLDSVWHRPEGGDALHLAGAPGVPEVWGEDRFEVQGSAFLQVNRGAARLLEEFVLECAGEVEGKRVLDGYCGIGTHGRRLALRGASVVGIELDPAAVATAQELAPAGCTVRAGRVEEVLPPLLPADLLILNPPRAGLDPAVVAASVANPPERMIYISCDPATLARDVRALAPRFVLAGGRCFDLFPQTAHVETVLVLHRRPPAEGRSESEARCATS